MRLKFFCMFIVYSQSPEQQAKQVDSAWSFRDVVESGNWNSVDMFRYDQCFRARACNCRSVWNSYFDI